MKPVLTESMLSQTVREALRLRDQMRADGASEEDLTKGLAQTLRASWPQTRAWHYDCDGCSDTGWQDKLCTPATPCGRPFDRMGQSADDYTGRGRCGPSHTYVVPCFCRRGEVKRVQRDRLDQVAAPEDYLGVGRVSKPTRFGR